MGEDSLTKPTIFSGLLRTPLHFFFAQRPMDATDAPMDPVVGGANGMAGRWLIFLQRWAAGC